MFARPSPRILFILPKETRKLFFLYWNQILFCQTCVEEPPHFWITFQWRGGGGRGKPLPWPLLLPPHARMHFLTVSSQNPECSKQEKSNWSFSKIWEDLQSVPVSPSLSQLVLSQEGHLFLKKILSSNISYLMLWLHCLETVLNEYPKDILRISYLTLDIIMNIVDNFSDILNIVFHWATYTSLPSAEFSKRDYFLLLFFLPVVVSCLK